MKTKIWYALIKRIWLGCAVLLAVAVTLSAIVPASAMGLDLIPSNNPSDSTMEFQTANTTTGSPMLVSIGDELWDNRFNVLGVNGDVRAIAVSGNDVYVGGQFGAVGALPASNVARWSSITGRWSALDSGVSGPVNAIAVSGSDIYVGGVFATAGGVPNTQNIGKWNGTSWSALGSGVSGPVQAIAASSSDIYVGGLFAAAGGVPNTQNIGKWNGTNWSALDSGVSGPVNAIAVSGSDVYVGGLFAAAGGAPNTQNIGKWNGTSWSALDSGVSGSVQAIAVSGSDVYVGGQFAAAGGAPNTQNIGQWNGTSWSALGSGVSGSVQAMVAFGSDLYIGGQFAAAGAVANTRNTAKWNGTSWSALGSGVGGPVYAIGIGVDGVYVGGLFAQAGNKVAQNFGLWRGTVPPPLNPDDVYWDGRFGGPPTSGQNSTNGWICAIAVNGSDVYVGGGFTMAGGVPANNIAKWDSVSNTWSALGSGISSSVTGCIVADIAVSGDDVYVGGQFTSAGGVPGTHGIARWNGSNWSALGGGVSGPGVAAVAVDGGIVYVAGLIPSVKKVVNPTLPADYLLVNNIAGWNGQWFALGSGSNVGLNTPVQDIEASEGNLYVAAGFLTMAGGVPVNNIAMWNGTNWSAMGSGLNPLIIDIAVSGDVVYAGGSFTTIPGGAPANYIARWNGTNWSPLGSGLGSILGTFGPVNEIATIGDDAYVVGNFNTAGGAPARRIARWNNSTETWSALGSGLNSDGRAVAVGADAVYVGGLFSTAGGKTSNFFGLWHTAFAGEGSISGRVLEAGTGAGVPGARVQVCRTGSGGCFWTGITGSQGNYLATGLPDGSYRVMAYPPASHNLLPGTIGPLRIVNGSSFVGQDIFLEVNQPPPTGTTISPVEGQIGGLPSLHWRKELQLVTHGCPGGSASYQILQDGTVIRSGSMTESPPPAGRYVGVIAPLHPHMGYATIRITIQCPDGSTQTINFAVYIDPSGTVRTIQGDPIEGATVTLSYFDTMTGTFTIVPTGDAIMSPANRTNPDTTDAEGHFGWDVVAGFYKVRAEKAGCVAPFDASQAYVETDVLVIPPPVTDLDLRLDCGSGPTITASAGGPYSVDEGASVTVTASGSDPAGGTLTYTWDLDNDGTFETLGQSAIFSAASLDGPSSYTIAVQVTNSGGLTATDSTTVNVVNVVPTASFTGTPDTVVQGQSATLVFSSQFDPGMADTAAGFLYSYDCTNDDTFELAGSKAASYTCAYPTAGIFAARGRIVDKDGGFSDYTVEVIVLTPHEAIEGLIDQVQSLIDDGALNLGQGNALIAKLEAAIQQLGRGNVKTAVNQLEAFANQVNEMNKSGILSPADGLPLLDAANAIIAALGG